MRPARLASVLLVLVLPATACGPAETRGGAGVRIVAAENVWGDIARQLGGARVSVRSIIGDPRDDPHQYESAARDAASVADADIVIVNGAGYDDFVGRLLSKTSNDTRVVVNVGDVLRAGSGANPHLWYDLPRVPEVARAIESALATVAPGGRASFAANLKTFRASLVPAERLVAEIRTRYPHAPVAYTERFPGYLLDAAGLTVASPPGFARAIEDGNEPSAGDAQAMQDLITQHRIRALLYNAQATSPVTERVQDLARRAGIPVVAVTETLPEHEPSFQAWQQHQLDALLTALGG